VGWPDGAESTVLYQKNLPIWERGLRVMAAAAMIGYGLIALQGTGIGYLLAGAGVLTALTGFLGFCPACAMVGRRLSKSE